MDATRKRRFYIAGAILAAVTIALALAWRFTDLAEVIAPSNLIATLEGFSSKWWAPIVLAAIYTPACMVMFPRPLLTLAAVVVFGPVKGFAVAMSGVLVSALFLYFWGRRIDEKRLRKWAGKRYDRMAKMLRKTGFVAIATLGLLPVAPFAIEMVAAGAARVRIRDLLPGVALAHLPGMLGLTVLGDQIMAAFRGDRQVSPTIIAVVVIVMVGIFFFTRHTWKRMQDAV